jgi:D-alanyl-D-alanine carboxypeptidase (penicillin-binding protein 5/6)
VAAPSLLSSQTFSTLDTTLTASGVVIVDLDSGQTLYERGAEQSRAMASLTKLMTALIIVENHALDELVPITQQAVDVPGNSAYLPLGHRFTVEDLLSAMLIPSANDATLALALFHAGSTDAFSKEMNQRAIELGLEETTYENAVGLDDDAQRSSPRDLALLAMTVLRHDAIRERMSKTSETITSKEGMSIHLVHSHQLLHLGVASDVLPTAAQSGQAIVSAGKTGTTDSAGQCLLSIVEADARRYIVVLLHARDRYADMQTILHSFSR